MGPSIVGIPLRQCQRNLKGLLSVLIGALAVETLLFGLTPMDPVTVVVGVSVLAGVALAATYVPVRRIPLIEPSAVLRDE